MFRYRRRKKFNNPFFKRHTSRKSIKKIIRLVLIIFFILIITLSLWFFLTPKFRIKNIEIEGAITTSRESLEGFSRSNISHWDNYLIFNSSGLENKIKNNFLVSSVCVEKKWPDSIKIKIEEYMPYAVWKTGDKIYLVERGGLVLRQILNIEEGSGLPIFVDDELVVNGRNESISLNKAIFDMYEKLKVVLNNTNITLNLAKISTIDGSLVKFLTSENWEIYTNPIENIENQVEKLKIMINKIKSRSTLQYIDLRFEDRIYYK